MAEYGLGEFTRNNNTYKYVAEIDIDSALSPTSENPVQNKIVKEALDTKANQATTYTKTEVDAALALKANQATTYTKTETDNAIAAAAFIPTSAKGAANGVAELDNNGKIPSAQLPSYVDDVIEGYYNSTTDRFYEESSFTTVIPPEDSKSWVDITSNKSYRWSGSVYARVDEGVQLGTTHGSAAYGDEGLAAYQHSQVNSGNPHGTNLDDLSNVSIDNNITNGQVLKYENGEWINGTGGSTSLSNLSDTSIVNPNNGQVLKYNGTNWINSNESGGGTTVIPNPQGTPTDELNSIQIGDTIYEIAGGSGGGSSILTGYTMPTSSTGNNGDVYILFDALDPSYINPNFSNFGLSLTNWTYDYSDHFEIIYKMNSRQSGNWAPFIGTPSTSNRKLYMQYNGWGNLSLVNMYYNGVFSGDQTIPIDSIYDYVNYYKFVGNANNFTFYKGPALDNITIVAAQYTFSAATGSSGEVVNLFRSVVGETSTFDMNLYGIKVYNSNNELIHDYIPIANGLHDKVDNTDYVTSTSGHISHIGVPSGVLGIYYKNEGTWILISNDGTSVIANPIGTPTDELNSIQIGDTIYEIAGGGTTDYEDLSNKPTINGVALNGDISLPDLGLKEIITLSQAEYDALDPEEKANPDILYYINDASPTPQAITLENLSDVDITSPAADGDILVYDDANDKWVNEALTKSTIGLGNVDNTSDANKPISTATQAALDGKADTSDIEGSKTATGSIVTVTDAADIYAEELSVDLEPIQDLHGYDKPWVGGAGKNKIDVSDIPSFVAGYIFQNKTLKAGNYTLSFDIGGTISQSDRQFNIIADNITLNTENMTTGRNHLTFVLPNDTTTLKSYCNAGDISITNIMVESGSTATAYEPYSNISPIQGYDIVSVDRCGKNLFDGSIITGRYLNDTGAYYPNESYKCSEHPVRVNAGDKNYMSYVAYRVYYDKSMQFIGTDQTGNAVVTVPANAYYMNFYQTANGTPSQIMVAKSNEAVAYEAPNHQEVSLQLGNKNLLPMTVEGLKAVNTSGTWSGNVYNYNGVDYTVLTNEDGLVSGIKANGTGTTSNGALFVIYDWSTTLLEDNTSYTLNGCPSDGSVNTYYLTVNNSSVSGGNDYEIDSGSGVTFTTKTNRRTVCRIVVKKDATISNKIFYPMLRSATVTDPTFSPYNPTLGGMVYGGQLTLNDDGSAVFVGDRATKILNGSENWQLAWEGTRVYYETNSLITDGKIEYSATGVQGISDKYVWLPFDTNNSMWTNRATNVEPYGAFSIRSNGYCYVKDVNCADANALKTYLTSNPLQVVYTLATPFTLHLSAEQLKLLQGTNNVWSNAGNVTLKYQPDNVIAEPKADVQRLRDDVDDRLVGNACRNLVEFPIKTLNGITSFKDSGKNLILNGTASASTNFDGNTFHLDAGTYTFSINEKLPSGTWFSLNNMGKTMFNGGSETKTATFTLDEGDYYFHLAISNGVTFNNYVLNPMVERGSSPSAYEEYYPSNRELAKKIDEVGGISYSTTEQIIGTWIDGKPLYRKVLNNGGNPLPSDNDVSDLNIETLIHTDAIGSDNSNYNYPKWALNSVSANSSRIIYMPDANTIKREGQYNVYSIILEYTKTTD